MKKRLTGRNIVSMTGVLAALVGPIVMAPPVALAETTIAKGDDWEIFLNGRVNAFFGYARGDAFPAPVYDPSMPGAGVVLHAAKGGGLSAFASRPPANGQELAPGTIEDLRIRSGFSSNVFGFGVRRQLTQNTRLTGYMSIWAIIESEARRKYSPVPADVREGYMKFEGPWGSLLAGRALTLMDRGASEIDFMYAHGFGLGYPGDIDVAGPAAGHIGFGVLGAGFAAGFVYATPKTAGFQLSVGYYDPANLAGTNYERTKFGRPEAELTFDAALGNIGRVHLFGNGLWQKVYQADTTEERTVWGAGYGGRFEVGPVHLGLAGHYGRGLGLYYALQPDTASTATENGRELRRFIGYYGQLQVVLGKWDLATGYGLTAVFQDPSDQANAMNSYIKNQLGASGGVVYHVRDYLALDLDYFRAEFNWWRGEKQVVHFVNAGVTLLW